MDNGVEDCKLNYVVAAGQFTGLRNLLLFGSLIFLRERFKDIT
jgi:hypothetical protein